MVLSQFGNGWVHGEQLSESAKVHPLLKPYRALSEKVVHPPSYTMHAHTLQTTPPDIQYFSNKFKATCSLFSHIEVALYFRIKKVIEGSLKRR